MKQTIYLVGPTTGTINSYSAFEQAEKELSDLGYNVLNPHKICEDVHRSLFKTDAEFFEHCERLCLAEMIGFAHFIVTMNLWEYCKRATKEVNVARQMGYIQVHNIVKILADASH